MKRKSRFFILLKYCWSRDFRVILVIDIFPLLYQFFYFLQQFSDLCTYSQYSINSFLISPNLYLQTSYQFSSIYQFCTSTNSLFNFFHSRDLRTNSLRSRFDLGLFFSLSWTVYCNSYKSSKTYVMSPWSPRNFSLLSSQMSAVKPRFNKIGSKLRICCQSGLTNYSVVILTVFLSEKSCWIEVCCYFEGC